MNFPVFLQHESGRPRPYEAFVLSAAKTGSPMRGWKTTFAELLHILPNNIEFIDEGVMNL